MLCFEYIVHLKMVIVNEFNLTGKSEIWVFVQIDVIFFLQESTSSLEMVANDLSDYYAEKGHITKIERYCQVTNHIATKLCYKFVSASFCIVVHVINLW